MYSFTVPALKLMKVKFCLFLATTAHCHDRAVIKIRITHFTSMFNDLLLLDEGWTTKSPTDGNKSLSLPKSICSQEVVSSCLGKDLSVWRRSPISGTDYSGRDHIIVKYCFWIARLVMKHS